LCERSVFFAREVGIPCPKGPYLTLPRSDASSQFGLFAFAGLRRASAVLEAGLYRIVPLPMSPRPCARGRYSAQRGWNTCARGRYSPGRSTQSDSFPRSGRVAPCHETPYSCVRGRYSLRPVRPTTTSRYDSTSNTFSRAPNRHPKSWRAISRLIIVSFLSLPLPTRVSWFFSSAPLIPEEGGTDSSPQTR
jgi:hypothetical protein